MTLFFIGDDITKPDPKATQTTATIFLNHIVAHRIKGWQRGVLVRRELRALPAPPIDSDSPRGRSLPSR